MDKIEKIKKNSLSRKLLRDIKNTVGSIYRLNAPHAIGYLFYTDKNGQSIYRGMYCNWLTEIDNCWEYFLKFEDNCIYKIV
jgi:hypothetical protein